MASQLARAILRWLLPLALVLLLLAGLESFLRESPPYPDLSIATREYASGRQLDLIQLRQPASSPRPVLVFLHGGGWASGNRKWRDPLVITLARAGYLAVSVDYRLSHQAPFPAQIQDCKAAVRWLRAHAAELQLDPDRVVACGVSAGGHLAALLGTSAGVPELEGSENPGQRSDVQAVIDLYGPTDLSLPIGPAAPDAPDSMATRLLGGPPSTRPELARQADPVTWADPGDPPVLILHGDRDVMVPLLHSQRLARALESQKIATRLVVVPGAGHGLVGCNAVIEEEAREFLALPAPDTQLERSVFYHPNRKRYGEVLVALLEGSGGQPQYRARQSGLRTPPQALLRSMTPSTPMARKRSTSSGWGAKLWGSFQIETLPAGFKASTTARSTNSARSGKLMGPPTSAARARNFSSCCAE